MSTAIWWSALAAGSVSFIAAGVAIRRRAFGLGRIPRLGFVPPRTVRPPWWSHALLFVGALLVTLGAGRLSDAGGSYVAYFGGAVLVAVVVQALLVGWHNHRSAARPGDTLERAPTGATDAA